MTSVFVPIPVIFAPIATSALQSCCTCGSLAAFRSVVCPFATLAPSVLAISSMLRTSRMCGRLRSVTGSSVRRLAAISGSASFLLPAGVISPRSGVPPSTTKRAIARKGSGSLRLEAEVGGDLVERRPVGLGVLGPCREGDDERVLPLQGDVLEERRVELPVGRLDRELVADAAAIEITDPCGLDLGSVRLQLDLDLGRGQLREYVGGHLRRQRLMEDVQVRQ